MLIIRSSQTGTKWRANWLLTRLTTRLNLNRTHIILKDSYNRQESFGTFYITCICKIQTTQVPWGVLMRHRKNTQRKKNWHFWYQTSYECPGYYSWWMWSLVGLTLAPHITDESYIFKEKWSSLSGISVLGKDTGGKLTVYQLMYILEKYSIDLTPSIHSTYLPEGKIFEVRAHHDNWHVCTNRCMCNDGLLEELWQVVTKIPMVMNTIIQQSWHTCTHNCTHTFHRLVVSFEKASQIEHFTCLLLTFCMLPWNLQLILAYNSHLWSFYLDYAYQFPPECCFTNYICHHQFPLCQEGE